jgi:hypothetical protein
VQPAYYLRTHPPDWEHRSPTCAVAPGRSKERQLGMGSHLSSGSPRRESIREQQSRRRTLTRRMLFLLVGIIGLAVLLLRGYGPYYLNLSPGTDSGGLISIATHHSQYRLTESIHITVTNRLHTPIYTVFFPDYYCSIYLVSEWLHAGQWWDESLGTGTSCPNPTSGCCAGCSKPVPHPNEVRQIDPSTAYMQSWHPGSGTFASAGPHRILFVYSTDQQTISQQAMRPGLEPVGPPDAPGIPVVTSATLQLEDDGYRPPPPMLCE